MNVRCLILAIALVVATGPVARAADVHRFSFSDGFAGGGFIPDGDGLGWSDTRQVGGISKPTFSVDVELKISGGYNGDLFCYLTHGNELVPLLNRVGVGETSPGSSPLGYGEAGFDVRLRSSGAEDIHWYRQAADPAGSAITGLWQPDGRAIDPGSPPAMFDASSGRVSLGVFAGGDANGSWTLFLADLSAGGGQSQLLSWSLVITEVPEPGAAALLLLGAGVSWWRGKRPRIIGRSKIWSASPSRKLPCREPR